jgi:hypothetical protein
MEFFSKYKAAALKDVASGACVVLPHPDKGDAALVAIKIGEHDAFEGTSVVIALWDGASPFTPSRMLLDDAQALEILGAGAQVSTDPADVHFGPSVPVGALYLFGGEPHVRVASSTGVVISVRLTDGTTVTPVRDSVPWFPFWTVAVPDADGRMATICSIDVRKPGP